MVIVEEVGTEVEHVGEVVIATVHDPKPAHCSHPLLYLCWYMNISQDEKRNCMKWMYIYTKSMRIIYDVVFKFVCGVRVFILHTLKSYKHIEHSRTLKENE